MASSLNENLKLAMDTVRSHKMRSGLTMLGVFVGTITLMAIGSILTGMNKNVVDELEGFGTNTIFVYKFQPGIHVGGLTKEERLRKPISDADVQMVRADCSACSSISPEVFLDWGTPTTARHKGHEVDQVDFSGVESTYPEVNNETVGRGRFFTPTEDQHRDMVVVVGSDIATNLFPNEDPVNSEMTIDGHTFRVIGVFAKRKAAGGDRANVQLKIPYHTFAKLYPNAKEHFFSAAARPGMMNEAMDEVRMALRRSRHDAWNAPDSFGMATADSIIAQFHDITAKIALVIIIIASIGMLIGGVGVMNIMLVSVTERTREIGVRKAIGARRADITQQFLSEAVFLTGTGGLLGIIGGWLISLLLNVALPSLPSSVPLWAVVVGFSVSVFIGVFFGLFPAVKAAKLDPVDALRYE